MSSEIKTKSDAMERPPSKKPIQKFVVSMTFVIERAALEQAVDRGGVRVCCVGGGWVAAAKWNVHKNPMPNTQTKTFSCFS